MKYSKVIKITKNFTLVDHYYRGQHSYELVLSVAFRFSTDYSQSDVDSFFINTTSKKPHRYIFNNLIDAEQYFHWAIIRWGS